MKLKLIILLLLSTMMNSQTSKVSSGSIQHFENFKSEFIPARNVDVWLPEGYSDKEKYDVLYMHDGQMLFDASKTWNKQAWEVDDIAAKLIADGITKKFIIVGIWNLAEKRHQEYFPQKPYESLNQIETDTVTNQLKKTGNTKGAFKPYSDLYLKFLVTELKPFIDKTFSVYTTKEHTFIAGSSMGGLISLYAICEYPNVFGGTACLSTHWPGTFTVENNPMPNAFCRYLIKQLPDPKNHKIYFDYGDQTLDALYPPLQAKVDTILKDKGFDAQHWITKFFPGEAHSENAWQKRVAIPLEFLLGK